MQPKLRTSASERLHPWQHIRVDPSLRPHIPPTKSESQVGPRSPVFLYGPKKFHCASMCENQVSRSVILKLSCLRELPGILLNADSDLFGLG